MKRGASPTFSYEFVNSGNEPIEFDIVSGCECSDIDWPEGKVFEPGERGAITVTYVSAREEEDPGKLEKVIDVFLKNEDPVLKIPIIKELKYVVLYEE